MKHRMIVTKVFRPRGSGGPENKVGDEFDATDSQRNLWKALKWADDAPEKPQAPAPRHTYQTRAVEVEKPAEQPAEQPMPPAFKRAYRRRDLTAEGNTPE